MTQGAQQQCGAGGWGWGAVATCDRDVLGNGGAVELFLSVRKCGDLYVQGWGDNHMH